MQGNGECVRFKDLRKEFNVDGSKLVAVDNVSLTCYRDEIFVLLGHNGAGKTTTFSMLTGLIPSTSGDASFFGRTIKEQMSRFRADVGICPQHSVLWDDLTVMEHLLLFASFKGVPLSQAKEQARNLLLEQNMGNKGNSLASTLSGGMRRKLSLAVAFMGNPKLVYLDEPSSGMDITARRETWDLLKTRKEGRVIIFTTHYMDEADELSDRVAIMSHGQVRCCGTAPFLKNAYGCGYNLSFNCRGPAASVADGFMKFLQEQCFGGDSKVELMGTSGNEMLFLAPFEVAPKFEVAFNRVGGIWLGRERGEF